MKSIISILFVIFILLSPDLTLSNKIVKSPPEEWKQLKINIMFDQRVYDVDNIVSASFEYFINFYEKENKCLWNENNGVYECLKNREYSFTKNATYSKAVFKNVTIGNVNLILFSDYYIGGRISDEGKALEWNKFSKEYIPNFIKNIDESYPFNNLLAAYLYMYSGFIPKNFSLAKQYLNKFSSNHEYFENCSVAEKTMYNFLSGKIKTNFEYGFRFVP